MNSLGHVAKEKSSKGILTVQCVITVLKGPSSPCAFHTAIAEAEGFKCSITCYETQFILN